MSPLPAGPFNEADMTDKPAAIRAGRRSTRCASPRIQETYQQRLESLLAVDEARRAIVERAARPRASSTTP